jgi:hypothetical protein
MYIFSFMDSSIVFFQPLEELIGNFPYTLDVPGMIIENIYKRKKKNITFSEYFQNLIKKIIGKIDTPDTSFWLATCTSIKKIVAVII